MIPALVGVEPDTGATSVPGQKWAEGLLGNAQCFGPELPGRTQAAGLTLAKIRSVPALRDSGQAPCAQVGTLIEEHLTEIDRRMAELRQGRTVLRELDRRAAVTDPAPARPATSARPSPGPDTGARRQPLSICAISRAASRAGRPTPMSVAEAGPVQSP
ncbi:MerR family DNA-binding protein [Streptomyces sp. DH10]|uniref:MerR family DNA-binding protein n=1 Tax=Streptomyces sp. DH10 TaxID=3040121 RepID=UPI002442F0AA|nr:MerR family DNA-binding protein [Streptomyces sp. DH10]MDG9711364.1 MerR family DNA-binding protein [Streptomyces sp. DH10]